MNSENHDNMDKGLAWERVSTQHIVKDEWIDFRKVAYRLPDGTVWEPFYNFSRRSYAVIVASDPEGNLICVKQYRHGIEQVTTEFPAGGIEYGTGKEYMEKDDPPPKEKAIETARRELLEETGYVSDEWSHLITVPSCATLADNYAYIFRAKNCRRVKEQELDETEFLNVLKVSPDEINSLIEAGKFQQAVHIMAWLLAQREECHG